MSVFPVRNLAATGVIRDVDPPSTALDSFSDCRNVIFQDGKVFRAPQWKRLTANVGAGVRYVTTITPSGGNDQIILAYDSGVLGILTNAAASPTIASTTTPAILDDSGNALTDDSGNTIIADAATTSVGGSGSVYPWTSAVMGDVLYVNRNDAPPQVLTAGSTTFQPLSNWGLLAATPITPPVQWTCMVLRTFQSYVIALNVTKGNTQYPTMVKISDITFYGSVPGSWDQTDLTKLAYENQIAGMDGPIIDGLDLNQLFLIYTANQVWVMQGNPSSSYQWSFYRLFKDDGVVNANCVVEAGGRHYVFGQYDLYWTDGTSKTSLADGFIKRWMYRYLDKTKLNRCFAYWAPITNEVFFCHVSKDPDCTFTGVTGCNNAAVYNITAGTWSFVDLPNVSSMCTASVSGTPTWATDGSSWASATGAWNSTLIDQSRYTIAAQADLPTSGINNGGSVLGYDFAQMGFLGAPLATDSNGPAWVERTGITFDFVQAGYLGGMPSLPYDKRIRKIFPQCVISLVDLPFTFEVSASINPIITPTYDFSQTFDPTQNYSVDVNESGRIMALRVTFPPTTDATFAGFDVDYVLNGKR